MLAGAATVRITPPLPVQLAGYGVERLGDEVADELHARAIVCEEAGRRLAVVSCDLLWLERRNVARIRDLTRRAGLTPEAVMVACTHTHSGPDTIDWYDHAPVDPAWLDALLQQIAGAVWLASRRLEPVTAVLTRGSVTIGVNRRGRIGGEVRLSPDEAGPVDHTLTALRLVGGQDRLVAAVVCQQTHPVLLGGSSLVVSADWPGEMCRSVEQALGGVCVFLNGASGDINPRAGCGSGYAEVLRVGRRAAGAAVELLSHPSGQASGSLAFAQAPLALPHKPHPYLHTPLERRLAADGGLRSEVQAMRIGPLAILTAPGECLTETGARILEAVGLPGAVIAGNTNDYLGYLPLPHIWDEGGYEPSATMTTVAGVQAFIAAAIAVGERLKQEPPIE